MKIISLSVVLIISLLITTQVYAANETRANTATSFSGSTLKSVMPSDSQVSGYGAYAKVTLYLATTNDETQGMVFKKDADGKKYIDMENTPVTRKDGEPMFVKFGQSIITKNDYVMPQASYVNLYTSKFDALIDYKKGEKHYPVYDTMLTDSQLSDIGVPRWIVYINGVATNNHTNVVNYFKGNGNAILASENLRDIIFEVAEKSDSLNAIGRSAINNVLNKTKQKASFWYLNDNGQKVELSVDDILPTNPDNLANWLIVYEPVINYHEDPNKMFFPTKGGSNFLITATDAVLQNMHAGAEGYQSVVKFLNGSPKVVMHYNHCRLCDLTWYGYPEWPHANLPLATYCPLPCPGVSSDYDGVKTKDRYPFSISSAVKAAAKNFTIEYNWLRYSGGYLFDKPTESMNVLVEGTNTDNIIHYGGYSLFVNGPAKAETSKKIAETSKKIPVYLKVVVVNKDYSFTTVPFVKMNLTTKNDMTSSQQAEADESAMTFIQKHKGIETALTEKYNRIKNGTLKYNAETDSGYTPIAFIEEEVDYSDLLKNIKIYPQEIEGLSKSVQMKNFNLSSYESNIIQSNPNYPVIDLTTNINNYLDVLKEAADSANYIGYDGTITLKDGTKIGPNEEIQPNWDRFIVHASNEEIDSLNDIKSVFNIMFYDKENPAENIPMAFTYKGDPIYITIILSIVKSPDDYTENIVSANTIYENELMKAMNSGVDSAISRVVVKKTVNNTSCNGYVTVSCKHPDPNDPTKKLHSYDKVSCGHSKTLSNAKDITPKTITVQPSWYWNSSMFDNISKLSVLRNSGALVDDGVTFVFNTTSSFVSDNMNNAFDKITRYRFLTHRNGGNNQPLQLAAYMNNTELNKAFLNFINPYYSNYPSAYSNPNGNFGGGNYTVETSLTLPSSVTAIGSGRFCSGGSSNSLNIPVKLSGEMLYGVTTIKDDTFRTKTDITVQPTISQSSKTSPDLETESVYWGLGDPDLIPSCFIRFESQPISFFPAFKMQYQDSNDPGSPFKDVWILANGERVFKSHDLVTFEILESKIDVFAPWSRDREDRWVDPNSNNPTARTIPTLKSGSMLKADASGTTLRVTVNVHMQDPAFLPESQRATLQAKNDGIIEKYDNMVKDIIERLKKDGLSYYSNLLQATTPETIHYIPSGNSVIDLSAKTTIRLAAPVDVHTNIFTFAAYVDNDNKADYDPAGNRTINIKGQNIQIKRWQDINIIKSNAILKELLVENGGDEIPGWYNESFEGIIIVSRVYLLELQNLMSTYTQVHPYLSDWQTERNANAKELSFVPDNKFTLIKAGQFGIGLEIRFPEIDLGGQNHKVVLNGYPYLFDIRGSVYDN
jgi:hypothetical protein